MITGISKGWKEVHHTEVGSWKCGRGSPTWTVTHSKVGVILAHTIHHVLEHMNTLHVQMAKAVAPKLKRNIFR